MELFPVPVTIGFHGFDYTTSSKPIEQGELCLYIDWENRMWLSMCLNLLPNGMIKLRSSSRVMVVDIDRCKRLTFSMPLKSEEWFEETYAPAYSMDRKNPFSIGLQITVNPAVIMYN